MAHSSMQRFALRATFAGVLLMSASVPAMAGYKVLIKGPVCQGPDYCATAEIGGSGQVSITLPAYDNPSTPGNDMPQPTTFTGNVNLQQVVSEICKPGTNGQPEWLQAGSNVKGVTGQLTAPGGYTMTIWFAATANPNTQCNSTTLGQETMLYARGYTIERAGRPPIKIVENGSHHVYNLAAIPEPGSLLLLLAGMGALGAVVWRKKRR